MQCPDEPSGHLRFGNHPVITGITPSTRGAATATPAPPCEDRRFPFMGERGWGAGGKSIMRLQMHVTDPDVLERRLGERASNGCIRISATLNRFIDR